MSEGGLKIDDCGQWAERFVLEVAEGACVLGHHRPTLPTSSKTLCFILKLSVKENPRNPNMEIRIQNV